MDKFFAGVNRYNTHGGKYLTVAYVKSRNSCIFSVLQTCFSPALFYKVHTSGTQCKYMYM